MPKKPLPDDCVPKCRTCVCGDFRKGDTAGECHLLPMDWVVIGEGTVAAKWKPAMPDGWCKHFDRAVN